MNLKGCGRTRLWLNLRHYPGFTRRDWAKQRKPAVRIAHRGAEIWILDLRNMKQECYSFDQDVRWTAKKQHAFNIIRAHCKSFLDSSWEISTSTRIYGKTLFLERRPNHGRLAIKKGLLHLNSLWKQVNCALWYYQQGQHILPRFFLNGLKIHCYIVYAILFTAAASWNFPKTTKLKVIKCRYI
jgi:hypothetical protein